MKCSHCNYSILINSHHLKLTQGLNLFKKIYIYSLNILKNLILQLKLWSLLIFKSVNSIISVNCAISDKLLHAYVAVSFLQVFLHQFHSFLCYDITVSFVIFAWNRKHLQFVYISPKMTIPTWSNPKSHLHIKHMCTNRCNIS